MRFKRIYVEISNICNLNCPFCVKSTRPPRTMKEEEFRHIVREISPYTGYIYLHVKGEPLLHPQLERFLDICEENDLQVNLTTNGTLLTKNAEMLLRKNALRQVNFSLHSFPFHNGANGLEREFYNEVDLDGMETYVQNILRFCQRFARERKKYSVLRLWTLDPNREADPAACEIMKLIEKEYPEAAPLEEKMRSHRSLTLEKGVFLSWEEEFVWPSLKSPYVSDSGICYGTRSMLAILCDGTVVPCCLDANGEAPLGNIFSESFSSIIEDDYFQRVSNNFNNRHVTLPLCRHCTYRLRFDKLPPVSQTEEPADTSEILS
ncbi:MAG: radical SAM/SPASM domain-containing protein [Candidatus Merdivicinus sp.]|jgi:radical SAM protein with 4Fe4S-binding SPASM domain